MQQIILHRKGGRKPWVFETNNITIHFRNTTRYLYYLELKSCPIGWHIYRKERTKGSIYINVTKKIHADHFKLGNVTITF